MLTVTLLSLFLSCLHSPVSSEICQESNPCACKFEDGTYYDLSTVGLAGKARFSFMLYENDTLISYNPCYPFSYSHEVFQVDQLACIDVAACIITPGTSSGTPATQRAIGYQNTAEFVRDNGTVKINYSFFFHVEKKWTVTLNCSEEVEFEFRIDNETFTLSSWCACKNNEKCKTTAPKHSKSGLSTGSILLITFFVIILVYLGVGVLFNFCRGAHGTELLPNVEFWNELPKLIVDGFLFTCSCFGRRSSYADV